MDIDPFIYEPTCDEHGCGRPAIFKLAAAWRDITSRELKTYGLTCEAHRDELLEAARARQRRIHLSEGEVVETVDTYPLLPGIRDAELSPLDGVEPYKD